ncbi:hypothetical protein M231_05190 [Tremella mesenterica]|uniref:HPt domain-containing protein n=2 Tax=Tremella mesenterica TaxID=5217 RepID=A0A4Q1BIW1_TREME|nr:hypothetical protein M231_05190 [Tremella mesenterica]
MEVFAQILDMDDDDDGDEGDAEVEPFSRMMVQDFSVQAEKAFQDMQDALAEKDLRKLSSLGHFLKGSSAALGIIKVQACCEKIQHYGNLWDEEAGEKLNEETALTRIGGLIEQCKINYREAQGWFKTWYEERDK